MGVWKRLCVCVLVWVVCVCLKRECAYKCVKEMRQDRKGDTCGEAEKGQIFTFSEWKREKYEQKVLRLSF